MKIRNSKEQGRGNIALLAFAAAALTLVLVLALQPAGWAEIQRWYRLMMDREWVRSTVQSHDWAAPLVFIGIEIAQVIVAPFPGEATGFLGGYLFGALKGFIYSSIGLVIGSLINFGIGRFIGERLVRKLVPEGKFQRVNRLINRQGIIVIFCMFLIPGFPKDSLSLLLGLGTLPVKVFAVLAFFGRIPGTLLLSLQGASFYGKNFGVLAMVAGACLVLAMLAYCFRDPIYRWVEGMNTPEDST